MEEVRSDLWTTKNDAMPYDVKRRLESAALRSLICAFCVAWRVDRLVVQERKYKKTYLVLNLELVPERIQTSLGLNKDDQEQQKDRSKKQTHAFSNVVNVDEDCKMAAMRLGVDERRVKVGW